MNTNNHIRSKYLSVIVPVFNEEENIPLLHKRLQNVLMQQEFSYEIIYINDGSTDSTANVLTRVAGDDATTHVINFRRNFGQTAAMAAGVEQSKGEILIFMDGDLQNDPVDIPNLLDKISEGYDVVSGWRKKRQDAQLSRKLPSLLANRLISRVTGVHLHDYGCTLKAYRYEVLRHVRLYGEMHRFIPAYAARAGARITEIEVQHHARIYGKSKYGISRVVRVILDLITLQFLGQFAVKPMYAFGIPGLSAIGLALTTSIYAGARHIFMPRAPHKRPHQPLLPIALSLTSFGLISIMFGLIAELLMRTYHEAQDKPTYITRQEVPVMQSLAELVVTPEQKQLRAMRTRHAQEPSRNGKMTEMAGPGAH